MSKNDQKIHCPICNGEGSPHKCRNQITESVLLSFNNLDITKYRYVNGDWLEDNQTNEK